VKHVFLLLFSAIVLSKFINLQLFCPVEKVRFNHGRQLADTRQPCCLPKLVDGSGIPGHAGKAENVGNNSAGIPMRLRAACETMASRRIYPSVLIE